MKCKYCDGTGTSNWCVNGCFKPCDYCNGTGEVEVVGDSVTDVCDKCGGTGFFCEMRMGDNCTLGSPCPHQKPLTNEEWFCSLPTEEKVTALLDLRERIRIKMRGEIGSENKFHKGDYYRDWLKEKHHEV